MFVDGIRCGLLLGTKEESTDILLRIPGLIAKISYRDLSNV
jgi:hypothetical protein